MNQPSYPIGGTLPEVTVTASPDTAEPVLPETTPKAEVPATPEIPEPPSTPVEKQTPPEIPEPPSPTVYDPNLFITGGVKPKIGPSNVLAQVLNAPFSSLPTTGLTTERGAGEIESSESGKKRQNVWNEASLRLKDALGL